MRRLSFYALTIALLAPPLAACGASLSPPATPTPSPVPAPTAALYPTARPVAVAPSRQPQTVIDMGGRIGELDIATHPTEGWPAIAAVQWGWSHDTYGDGRVLVVVHEPASGGWGLAQSLNTSPVRQSAGGLALAIAPDRTLHVVYGDGGGPLAGRNRLWHASSRDAGRSWSPPAPIGDGDALDLAAGSVGELHLLARLRDGGDTSRLAYARFDGASWRWGDAPLSGDRLRGTLLTIALADGATRVIVAAPTRAGDRLDLALRDAAGPWQRQQLPTGRFLDEETIVHVAGLATLPPGELPLVAVAWSQYSEAGVFATISRDGGASWGEQEAIVFQPDRAASGWGGWQPTLALDPATHRLLAFWTRRDFDAPRLPWVPSVSARPLAATGWVPLAAPGGERPTALLPTVQDAGTLRTATTPNSRISWLAWAGRDGRVGAASISHEQVMP